MAQQQAVTIPTMVDYWERLQEAMTHAKVTLKDLQAHLGVSYQAMKKVADGKTKSLSAGHNSHAARFLGVNAHWLATGEETMELQAQQKWGRHVAQPPLPVHETVGNYIDRPPWPFDSVSHVDYERLSDRQKGLIEGYTKRLIEEASDVKSNGRHKAA